MYRHILVYPCKWIISLPYVSCCPPSAKPSSNHSSLRDPTSLDTSPTSFGYLGGTFLLVHR